MIVAYNSGVQLQPDNSQQNIMTNKAVIKSYKNHKI